MISSIKSTTTFFLVLLLGSINLKLFLASLTIFNATYNKENYFIIPNVNDYKTSLNLVIQLFVHSINIRGMHSILSMKVQKVNLWP